MARNVTPAERGAELERRILGSIALTRAMQLRVASFDGERLVLAAPLEPNLNDKGTGFAGSLATLATLSGWSLATLLAEQALDQAGVTGETLCEAAVFHSETDFLRPARAELRAEARLLDPATLPQLRERLLVGRRAKLAIVAVLGPVDDPVLRLRGDYAVWRRGTQPF